MRILIITPQNVYATGRFLEEAGRLGIEATCVDIHLLAKNGWQVRVVNYDALFVRQVNPYYDEVVTLARSFHTAGKIVVDRNIINGLDDSKWNMYQKLSAAGVRTPETTLYEVGTAHPDFPVVGKWIYGSKARQVHLARDESQLRQIATRFPKGELLAQQYIEADAEYKVITIGYKSLPFLVKYAIHATRRVSDLEHFEVVSSSSAPEIVELAEKASSCLGRELAKTDIIVKDGVPYLLEVNRQPGLQAFEQATGLNLAGKFLEYFFLQNYAG